MHTLVDVCYIFNPFVDTKVPQQGGVTYRIPGESAFVGDGDEPRPVPKFIAEHLRKNAMCHDGGPNDGQSILLFDTRAELQAFLSGDAPLPLEQQGKPMLIETLRNMDVHIPKKFEKHLETMTETELRRVIEKEDFQSINTARFVKRVEKKRAKEKAEAEAKAAKKVEAAPPPMRIGEESD